jgi:predicted MFS family arabinose efflux permease
MAMAQSTGQVTLAMVLIGAGVSPVLMAAYYIFAKSWPPAMFGTLASAMVGLGSAGNLAGSVPLAAAVDAFGWRATMGGLAAFTVLAAVGVLALLRDPPRAVVAGPGGSVLDVLAIRALWPIAALMFVAYAPAAAIRGLWAGPYLAQVHGLDSVGIGQATLVMGLAMVAGSFLYGPLDRLMGRRKWVIAGGNLVCCLGCLALGLWPTGGVWLATGLLAVIGISGATFGLIVAHARAFVPAHLTGRGVTLINLFAIAGAGVAQFALGPLFAGVRAGVDGPAPAFAAVFLTLAGAMAAGLVVYMWSQDRGD